MLKGMVSGNVLRDSCVEFQFCEFVRNRLITNALLSSESEILNNNSNSSFVNLELLTLVSVCDLATNWLEQTFSARNPIYSDNGDIDISETGTFWKASDHLGVLLRQLVHQVLFVIQADLQWRSTPLRLENGQICCNATQRLETKTHLALLRRLLVDQGHHHGPLDTLKESLYDQSIDEYHETYKTLLDFVGAFVGHFSHEVYVTPMLFESIVGTLLGSYHAWGHELARQRDNIFDALTDETTYGKRFANTYEAIMQESQSVLESGLPVDHKSLEDVGLPLVHKVSPGERECLLENLITREGDLLFLFLTETARTPFDKTVLRSRTLT